MQLTRLIDDLNSELRAFSCRPPTLVADFVLAALATDLLETGQAVQETSSSSLPHKAYPNARLAFETAQNLVVLAAHEKYQFAGAVAWVYFESKDARWRSEMDRSAGTVTTADQWLEMRVSQMASICNSASDGQGELLWEALTSVRRDSKKKPDNWLHENMARRHHLAYAVFGANGGNPLALDSAELNEKLYQALCRETHVRPRLDSFAVVHDRAANTIRIDIAPRNLERARSAVVAGTELSISEGITALRWQRARAV
jgi:hypothetical protein